MRNEVQDLRKRTRRTVTLLFAVALGSVALASVANASGANASGANASGANASDEDAPDENDRALKLEHLLDWEWVSSPQLSPGSDQIVFTRTWVDKINDKRVGHLWIMDADGSRPRFLTEGSSARWSPDGLRLAFLVEGEPRGSQIHVMWVDTREVTQITRLDESPSNLRWSPDGSRIAFSMQVPESSKILPIELPGRPKGAKWAEDPRIITRLNYRRDQRGYRASGHRHLFVVDADGGTAHQVTAGDFDHNGGEWTADGAALLFSGLRVEDADWQVRESEVYRVGVDDAEVSQLTSRVGPDYGPVPSPDGEWIAYTGFDANEDTYSVPQLYVMRADGSDAKSLTASLDRRPAGALWSSDSSRLFFNVDTEGTRQIYEVNLDGQLSQHTWGDVVFSATDVGHDDRLVGVASGPHQPADVAALQPISGFSADIHLLTDVNRDILRHVDLGDMEEVRFAGADGWNIQGWVIKPPDFDPEKKYPLILQIHGGPHSMYNVGFNYERQNHAAEGYVVLYTNPRGSTGYGKEFGNAIDNAYPSKDYDDLMAGVDWVLEQGYVDPERLYVYGGSGGGVLTCWIVGHTDRFRAAVSMFPVTNWISFVGTTDGPYWYSNFDKLPWEDISEHWDRSPLKYVGNVTTPTLMLTGEKDLRTPMAQTEEYYQALKLLKVDTAMIRVADEYHGAAGRHFSNVLRRILYVRGWFDKYDEAATEPATEAEATGG